MKPSTDLAASFNSMVRQYPEFAEFVESWRREELEQLPYGGPSVDVMRGRVQTLNELQRHLGLRK